MRQRKRRAVKTLTPSPGKYAWELTDLAPNSRCQHSVAGVRGKTVVALMSNVGLSADQLPAFLAKADAVLKMPKFPG